MSLTVPPRTPALHVGLIGAGGISHAHVPGWLALGAQVSVYSLEGADALAQTYGLTVVDSLDALWPLADIIDIVTPTATHHALALEAIRQGKHVVCEKPLALTVIEAEELKAAAYAAGVGLYPAHVVRYFPQYSAARDAIEAGRIGRPAVFRFRRQSAAPEAAWFFDDAASGGIVMDQMVHDLDQAEWLAGPVRRVFARLRRVEREGTTPVVSAHVVLDHVSGAISHVHGTWASRALPFSFSFDLAGDQGVLRYDSARDDATRLHISSRPGAGYLPGDAGVESPYAAELADFVRAIREGAASRVTAEDGTRAVRLAAAARRSIETGRPVDLAADDASPLFSSLIGAQS